MKSKVFFIITCLALLVPSFASASQCAIDNARVVSLNQWEDGSILIAFDKAVGCGCAENMRLGLNKDDNQKFLMSQALVAYSKGVMVYVRGDNVNNTCPIHGNTARILSLMLK